MTEYLVEIIVPVTVRVCDAPAGILTLRTDPIEVCEVRAINGKTVKRVAPMSNDALVAVTVAQMYRYSVDHLAKER